MNIAAIAGIAIVAAILSAVMKQYHREYSLFVTVAAGILILTAVLSGIVPILGQVSAWMEKAGIAKENAEIVVKSLGICCLAQFAADSCRDAGESALAFKVEFAGRLAVVLLSLPLFKTVAETAFSLIGGAG